MAIPKLSLVGDAERDAQVIKRARREVRAWRIRAVLLALIAGLFFRDRWLVFGGLFAVLALGAWQISRLIVRRTSEIQKKIELLGSR